MKLHLSKEEMDAAAALVRLSPHERDAVVTGQAPLTLSLREEDRPAVDGESLDRQPGESATAHAERLAARMREQQAAAAKADQADRVAGLVEQRLGVSPEYAEVRNRIARGEGDACDRAVAAAFGGDAA